MINNLKNYSIALMLILSSTSIMASDEESLEELESLFDVEIESKATTGSRGGAIDILTSKTPLDVISSDELRSTGYKKLSKALELLIPGFNVPVTSISDGSDHISFFTLRGLSSDQILVLVNGQRLHSSALVNVNTSVTRGSSGVDIDIIPISMIDHVEILRDGAAAQYGSDAIAGVVNIILKGANQDNMLSITSGATKVGLTGQTWANGTNGVDTKVTDGFQADIDAFYTYALKNDGFVNISVASRYDEGTNRAGKDYGDVTPKINSHYGDPRSTNQYLTLFTNINSDNDSTTYANVIFNYRKSSAGAYHRNTNAPAKQNSYTASTGYLPLIEPTIVNFSTNFGYKREAEKFAYDLSQVLGYNSFHFYTNNTINSSITSHDLRSFDSGELSYAQSVTSLNLTKRVNELNLASGAIMRVENYKIKAGELDSYAFTDTTKKRGSQGFGGFEPDNATNALRCNTSLYFDADSKFAEIFSAEFATRYEYYSDFGSTLNGKLAFGAKVLDSLNIRTSVSNGFRAPSLHQSHFTSISTQVDSSGNVSKTGTYAVDSAQAMANGAVALNPEKSTHATLGVVFAPSDDFAVTTDGFYVDIKDRIVLSQKYAQTDGSSVQYFANAADTQTIGADIRAEYKTSFENSSKLKLKLNYTYSKTKIVSSTINADEVVLNALSEGQPTNNVQSNIDYTFDKIGINLNINRVGKYKSIIDSTTHSFDAIFLTDLQLRYSMKSTTIMVGGQNILDVYANQLSATDSDIRGEGKTVSYSQYSPFGYNGAYYYIRAEYKY